MTIKEKLCRVTRIALKKKTIMDFDYFDETNETDINIKVAKTPRNKSIVLKEEKAELPDKNGDIFQKIRCCTNKFNLRQSIEGILIAVIFWTALTAWVEFILEHLKKYFGVQKSSLTLALIFTLLALITSFLLNTNTFSLLGENISNF